MNKKLYVGNLASEVTETDLNHNFSMAGKVASVAIIKDRYSGQSKGFGFVEMESEDGARDAITKFNGGELSGKTITVSEARAKTEREGGGGGFGGRGGRPGGGGGGGGYGGGGGGGRRY
jgi:RNA recognition motif-containing protein